MPDHEHPGAQADAAALRLTQRLTESSSLITMAARAWNAFAVVDHRGKP
ncbi:hypothetical protein [Ottowia thiooxydans]|uniref:Uncharacterized protein n=1 Tax=Ottowia thiooxydans TaxID=219182 RepID=A0ABV2QBL5_9BURK